jgi:hypothetical protein
MSRRKSLTRRFLHHLLLVSLARAILTLVGRGRSWDEWDDRDPEPEPARPRKRRFAQAFAFSALFFAGLAFSAGAGNTVRSLLEEDGTAPAAADGTTGATGATGSTGPTDSVEPKEAESSAQPLRVAVERQQELPPRPVAAPAERTATVLSARPTHSALAVTAASLETKRTAQAGTTRAARPSLAPRPSSKVSHKAPRRSAPRSRPAPKPPALDPEVKDYAGSTVWLNQAAPDPTPPAARLRLGFARRLVTFSRQAHVDWALVLATLRASGHNSRVPAGSEATRRLAYRLSSLGGRANPWAAALAYASDTSLADRVVALRHYYRAVGLASLVHGLVSQKADLQDRVLHDPRLVVYSGGRHDVASGHVDVRVLALLLYLAQTYREVTVSCLISGHRLYARPGVVSAHIYGRAVDIAALNNTSIEGHQQPGGLTDHAVRSILMLPGGMLPDQVISLLGLGGPSFPLANHHDHIHVGY